MKVVNSQTVSKPVILLEILDDGTLAAVNADSVVRILDKESLELISGFKVGITHQRYKTKVVAYSHDAKYFATLSADARESLLYNAESKKVIGSVSRHQGEVSCVGIDPLSRFMFSCGDDGKTFAIDTKSGKLVFTLPMHIDTVNDIAFSLNANWVATASYDRKVSLFNLVTMSPKEKFSAHSAPVMKLQFLSQNELLSIDKKSTAIVWDIHSGKVIQKLEGIHDDVTQICISQEDNLLFLATELGYILLYQLDTYKQLSRKYIKVSSMVTALEFDTLSKHLIVGTEDGFVSRYDIYEGQEKLKALLKVKNFEAIHDEIDKNPVLQFTKIAKLVSNFWNHTLDKAKILLQNGDRKTAQLLLQNFQTIPAKNTIIKKLFKDYENFDKFKQTAQEGKLSIAYNLANTYPVYKESKVYKALEEQWKKRLANAQKLALNQKGMAQAQELLAPYRGITQKTKFIQEVMSKGEIYKRFRVAIGQKDFKVCFELIKHNPFLKEFPEYDSLMKYADTLYIKAHKFLQDGDTHSAVKILRILSDFTDFKEEVQSLMKELESKQKFFNAIEEDDMVTAYNMMAIAEDLLLTKEGKELHEKWHQDLEKANQYASIGDADGVKRTLASYLNITSKQRSLATVFAWAYIVQLENALRDNLSQSEIENGIKNYVLNFGLLEQIESFCAAFKEKYPESKLNLELLSKGSLSMWRPSMIVNSILD
jgi:WD40 repeat protein